MARPMPYWLTYRAGYAAVPKEAKLRWQRVMANYLMTRPIYAPSSCACDPRRLTELDEILLDVIRPRSLLV